MEEDSSNIRIFIVSKTELKENMTPEYFSSIKNKFKIDSKNKILSELAFLKPSSIIIDKSKIYNYISIKDVNPKTGRINFNNIIGYLGKDLPRRSSKISLSKNDIIISLVRPELGNIALISNDLIGYIISNSFAIIHPKKEEDARYIYFMLRTKTLLDQMAYLKKGLIPNINKSQIIHLKIPYPGEEVRNKLISIFEQYYEKLENLNVILKMKKEQIDTLLKDEFQIERKDKPIEKPFFIVNSEKLENQFNVEYYLPTRNYFKIKNTDLKYKSIPLGKLAIIKRGKSVRSVYLSPYGYIYLKSGNIEREFLNLDGIDYVSPEVFEKFRNYFANSHEILLNLYSTDVESTGKTVIIPESYIDLIFNDGIAKLTINNNNILGHYFVSYLNLEMTRFELFKMSTGTVIRRISLKNLKYLPIKVPDIAWQKEFVEKKIQILKEIDIIEDLMKINKYNLENQIKKILNLNNFEV